jgi:hypothetical protein
MSSASPRQCIHGRRAAANRVCRNRAYPEPRGQPHARSRSAHLAHKVFVGLEGRRYPRDIARHDRPGWRRTRKHVDLRAVADFNSLATRYGHVPKPPRDPGQLGRSWHLRTC